MNTDEAVLDAMPELELLRQEFQICTNEWLPAWYRSRALEEAVDQREHSDKLGPAGLEIFKTSVEGLATCAEQITANHLGDEMWWHYDQVQTLETIVYSVRLCMGWLAVPLQRSGYLNPNHHWRETLVVRLNVPTGPREEREYEAVRTTRTVPTRRLFCPDESDSDRSCPSFWASEMSGSLMKYFKLVEQTQHRSEEQQRERGRAEEKSKAVGVEQILSFRPMVKAPPPAPFRLPSPPP